MRTRCVLATGLLLVAMSACADTSTPQTGTDPTTRLPQTTTPPTTEIPSTSLPAVCLSGDVPFVDSGSVARLGSGVGDAEQVGALRWAAHPGCERVVIDLLTPDAAPAGSVGDTSVAILADTGVVRVSLPRAVRTSGILDTRFDGDVARRAFVVRLADGSLAVDIHTASSVPIRVRAFTVDDPTRIVVDLAPAAEGGATVLAPPLIGDNVVLLSPVGGEATFPITVTGYARAFEATIVARILTNGTAEVEAVTTATDWLDAWGSFTLELDRGPSGSVTLFVGEEDARDGSPRGVSVSLLVP